MQFVWCAVSQLHERSVVNGQPARYDDPVVIVGASNCTKRAAGIIIKCQALTCRTITSFLMRF